MRKYKENKYFIFDNPFSKHDIGYWLRKTFHILESIKYKVIGTCNRPSKYNSHKYKVAICAIFKNEGRNIREWVEFHRIVGVEHFYLYNNNSEDDFMHVVKPYLDEGLITLIDWPYAQGQGDAYENCIEVYSSETKWLGFIDLDEFVIPKTSSKIYDFLKYYNNKPAVLIYWKVFGTSGIIERDVNSLVIESFTNCFSKLQDIGKCFYNTDFDYKKDDNLDRKKILNHELWTNFADKRVPPVNEFGRIAFGRFHSAKKGVIPIQINHYVTKSFAEYNAKCKGTDASFVKNPRSVEKLYNIDLLCTSVDFSAYGFLTKLKQALNNKVGEI